VFKSLRGEGDKSPCLPSPHFALPCRLLLFLYRNRCNRYSKDKTRPTKWRFFMSQIPRYFRFSLIIAMVLVVTGTILACGTSLTPEVQVAEVPSSTPTTSFSPTPSPTDTPLPTPTVPLPASPTPSPTVPPPSPTPAPAVSPTPSPAMASSDESCVNCHTDQEQLIANAKEEEVVEALSEGEG